MNPTNILLRLPPRGNLRLDLEPYSSLAQWSTPTIVADADARPRTRPRDALLDSRRPSATARSPHEMGQGDDLASFLEEASLSAYQPQLVALGVAAPADIADVDGVQHTRTTLNPKP